MDISSNLVASLEKVGLNTSEAVLYSLLLQEGNLTALELSKQSGIGRTNIYPHLRYLVSQGLVVELGKSQGFKASHPSKLRDVVAAGQLAAQERALFLESLLPRLQQVSRDKSGTLRQFDLTEGIKHVQDAVFHSPSREVLHLRPSIPSSGTTSLPRECLRRKITLRALTPISPENAAEYGSEERVYHTIVRYFDDSDLGNHPEMLLTGSTVCLKTAEGWLLSDIPEMVASYRSLLASLWNSTESSQNALQRRWKRLMQ